MSALPQGWIEVELGDVATKIGSGATPTGGAIAYKSVGIPLIRSMNIHFDGVRNQGLAFIDDAQASKLDNVIVQTGDVLLNITGASIGRVTVASSDYEGSRVNQHVCIIRPEVGVLPEYMSSYLASPAMQTEISNKNYGATRQALTKAVIAKFTMPLPPVSEQHRIMKKVAALQEKIARARNDLAGARDLVDQMKLRTLCSAFEGRLTGDINKQKTDPVIPGEQHDSTTWAIPTGWQWLRVDEVGSVGLGRQRSPENHSGPKMRQYIRSANITWAGLDLTDLNEMNFSDADFERFKLKVGDVLLNEGSGSAREVGKPAIWNDEVSDCCYQNTVLRVQPQLCSSKYLYYYFLYVALTGRFVASTQGVNIQHIGRDGLAKFPVPVPTGLEQDAIVDRIEFAISATERSSRKAELALEMLNGLNNAVLTKAFAGKLVPQDSQDEAADLILARIRTIRSQTPLIKPRRVKRKAMMLNGTEFLTDRLKRWPADGYCFSELMADYSGSYEDLKDAVFVALSGQKPSLKQVFDKSSTRMKLRKL